MTEIWKPVVGFEGAYEVSDRGRVRSLDRVVYQRRHWGLQPRRIRGQMLKPQRHSGGYVQFTLPDRTYLAHDLVAQAFIGPRPDGKEVCHNDGDQQNNRAGNLRYDAHLANCVDRKAHGCVVEGALNPQAKLGEADVKQIRQLAGTMRQKDVAEKFCIKQSQVSRIVTGQRWAHVA